MPNPANPQDLNRYSFVRNNPLAYVDPTGHNPDQPSQPIIDGVCTVPGVCLQQVNAYPIGWQKPYYSSAPVGVTSKYGKRGKDIHNGVDLGQGTRFPVLAARDGTVTFAGKDGTAGYFQFQKRKVDETGNPLPGEDNVLGEPEDVWLEADYKEKVDSKGNPPTDAEGVRFIWEDVTPQGKGYSSTPGQKIVIDHGHGVKSIYIHTIPVKSLTVGQPVRAGQSIGTAANIGKSIGPHLHFEIRINDQPVNPCSYVACPE